MKQKTNKSWFLVTLAVIANILIFKFMSTKLEAVVIAKTIENSEVNKF